jgi:uncharacterized membrane protein YeaQ/YmgE (transglycosylase-associated protein family)
MGEVIGIIIGALIAGIIIGPLARLVLPGKQDISIGMTILLGAAGALVGGLIYSLLGGGETGGIDWILLIVEVATAALAIVVYTSMQGGRSAQP